MKISKLILRLNEIIDNHWDADFIVNVSHRCPDDICISRHIDWNVKRDTENRVELDFYDLPF